MKPQTWGRYYNTGKIAPIQCVKCDLLKDLEIKDSCFLMVIIREGTACFNVREDTFEAVGPCFVCFDETDSPKLVRKRGLKCDSIYFHPTFLNISMTFSTIHSESYKQFADQHDMFLLKIIKSKSDWGREDEKHI